MNYWLTVHWPPRIKPPHDELGAWLADGKEQAAHGMEPGDLLLVYECATGRTEIDRHADGTTSKAYRGTGRQGLVKIASLESKMTEIPGSTPTEYTDGRKRWWRYFAKARAINTAGFVSRVEITRILGYAEKYNFRNLGTAGSGLRRLTSDQFEALKEAFVRSYQSAEAAADQARCRANQFCPSGEGELHRGLKLAIAADPAGVLGEPGLEWFATEYAFPTGDRVDLVLKDRLGRFVVVEVENECGAEELIGPLQCSKYRALMAHLHNRPMGEVRALLVAPEIHRDVHSSCGTRSIECVVVAQR